MSLDLASTSMSPPSQYSDFPCQVCSQPAHGKHFGAVTCRACAAFFRRSAKTSESLYKCDRRNECGVDRNGRFACKGCKMSKCRKVGMDSRKFIYGRDLIKNRIDSLPETIEKLSGKPSFFIYMNPESSRSRISYIDLQYLIDKGLRIMNQGSETPILQKNRLKKLLLGMRREKQGEVQIVRRIGKKEAIEFWERDFFAVAKWLTYFEDFQQLPERMKILFLKSIWHVWTRLEKLSLTAANRREKYCQSEEMMLEANEAYDTKKVEMDISWFTKFPKEKLKFLFDEPHEWMDLSIIQLLIDLQPTDIELTYMLCQLSFEYAGKRHQGEVKDVTERFQEVLANDLHDYYTKMNMPRYSFRLSKMMKINKMIQEEIRRKRVNLELAKIFPVYCVKFSHPEMFQDLA